MVILAGVPLAAAWDTHGYPWFDQWKVEERYMMPNGKLMNLPLRLHSHESVLTGTADLKAVRASFEEEFYTPVSVGGKAAVQIWMNNFTDTDCGNDDTRNPYLETWVSTWVTPKVAPLELPYESDMSLAIVDPRALVWIHRVILGDAPGINTSENDPAMGALLGGHNVWGFPKHKVKAQIHTEYKGADRVEFHAKHIGQRWPFGPKEMVDAVGLSMKMPETEANNIAIPVNVRTADDGVVGGPLNIIQQVRFGQAINVTQNIAPWNPKTDLFVAGSDEYYSSVIKAWKFNPKLKMHTKDFQIVAFKPANWLGKLAKKEVVV